MGLKNRFLRWRRSKGYGIHSPLAFRLIWRVLRPEPYVAYYGYPYVGKNPRARLLLRLTADVQPAYVWVSPGTRGDYLEAIRRAGGVVRVFDGSLFPDQITKADMVLLDGYKLKADILKKVLKAPRTVVAFDVPTTFVERAAKLMKEGVMLEGLGSFIMLCREEVSPMVYAVSKF